MPRRLKIKLRICCPTASGIHYAVPDSKSIRKLRELHVRRTGQGSMGAKIAHVPIGVASGYETVCQDYDNGYWSCRPKAYEMPEGWPAKG